MGYASQRNNTNITYFSFVVLFINILLLVECKSKDLLVSVSMGGESDDTQLTSVWCIVILPIKITMTPLGYSIAW